MRLAGTHLQTNKQSSFWLGNAQNVQNDNKIKISRTWKLRIKYKIKCPEEIQIFLKKIKNNSSKSCKVKTISKMISFLKR